MVKSVEIEITEETVLNGFKNLNITVVLDVQGEQLLFGEENVIK